MTTTIGPALGHGPWTQQGVGATPGYDAIDFRRSVTGFERGEGVPTYGSFRVSQRGAGANLSVDINMDDGAWVRGDAVTLQGLYYVAPHTATINETITTADATNPRIDQVVLEVKDTQHDASGSSLAQTRVIAGTPTGGATLDNRTGAAALPSSALLLADVLVAATDTSIVNAEIRDRRAFSVPGTVPPILTAVDMVVPTSPLPLILAAGGGDLAVAQSTHQVAVPVYLPRRIVNATRIRWKYRASAVTGNYNIAICDASGRPIVATGSTAFSSATNWIVASVTISASTFEAGWYYVLFGQTTNAAVDFVGWGVPVSDGGVSSASDVWIPNTYLYATSGGITLPTTILSMTDQNTVTGSAVGTRIKCPVVGISVG